MLEAENKFHHKSWQMMKKFTAALKTKYVTEVLKISNVQP